MAAPGLRSLSLHTLSASPWDDPRQTPRPVLRDGVWHTSSRPRQQRWVALQVPVGGGSASWLPGWQVHCPRLQAAPADLTEDGATGSSHGEEGRATWRGGVPGSLESVLCTP